MRKLTQSGTIDPGARVVAVLTGHLLKDPDLVVRYHRGELDAALYGAGGGKANAPIAAPEDPAALEATIARLLEIR